MLANNHIHDCGNIGIIDTINNLDEWGISHVGAGENQINAEKSYRICDDLVLLNYCQFGKHYLRNVKCAKGNEPGINGFDIEKAINDLNSLK